MSKLYVANVMRQTALVYYRLDIGSDGGMLQNTRFREPKFQSIPSGRQIPLGGDLHISQIEDIINQMNTYGMVGTVEIDRMRGIVPYVYSIDTPVSQRDIQKGLDHNAGIRVTQGQERRKKAAVAANDVLINRITEDQLSQGVETTAAEEPPPFELELEQVDGENAEGVASIAEGFRMEPAPSRTVGRRAR